MWAVDAVREEPLFGDLLHPVATGSALFARGLARGITVLAIFTMHTRFSGRGANGGAELTDLAVVTASRGYRARECASCADCATAYLAFRTVDRAEATGGAANAG